MKLTLNINMDNAAFGETDFERAAEVARILREYAAMIEADGDMDNIRLRDINGNRVGYADVSK